MLLSLKWRIYELFLLRSVITTPQSTISSAKFVCGGNLHSDILSGAICNEWTFSEEVMTFIDLVNRYDRGSKEIL